jgi:hypothetical protein
MVGSVYTEYLFSLGAQCWRLSQIPAMSDTYRDYIFPTPPATYSPYGASRPVYPQYYECPPAVSIFTWDSRNVRIGAPSQNDGTTNIHRATSFMHPAMPSNDIVYSYPGRVAHVAAYGPPSLVSVLRHLYSFSKHLV